MTKRYQLNPDVNLHYKNEYLNTNISNTFDETTKGMSIYVNLQGQSKYKSFLDNYENEIVSKSTSLDLVNRYNGILTIPKNIHRQNVSVLVSKKFVEANFLDSNLKDNFMGFFESNQGIKNINTKKSDPKTLVLAYEILNSPYENTLDKLYIESKSLELIHNEMSNLLQTQKEQNKVKLSTKDIEAIYYARDILIKNLANPPSIKSLAKIVALNDLKLKIGFNKFFGQSPYSLSLEARLQKSKELLYESDMNINEISQQVGYKHAGNFSKAFIKRFGIPPKELMKSRKYYY